MIIGACGYGATGSSVLSDLLSEYNDVQVFDSFEFVLPYIADGLEDLEYHLMKQYAKSESCDVAMRRFLRRCRWYSTPLINKPCKGDLFYRYSKEFIDEITQFRFSGLYTADTCTGYLGRDILAFASKKVFMPKIIEKVTRKPSYVWPCHQVRFAVEPENFYSAARKYIRKILEAMGADLTKPVCLDQPFAGNSPENSFRFFDDPYAIIIDRDPRDLFLSGKYSKDPNFKFMPRFDVKQFVMYYRNIRQHQNSNERILRLSFEDVIYRYDESVKKIESFLNLHNHINKKKIFDPARSINNTQLIRLHPEDAQNIRYIEKELPEFLYHFEDFDDIKFDGKPFDGSARKSFDQ